MRHALDLGKRIQHERFYGAVVVELGVSLSEQSYYPTYTAGGTIIRHYLGQGPLHWVRRRLKNSFVIPKAFGKSAETSSGALARIDEVLTCVPKPDWCFLQLGGDPTGLADFSGLDAAFALFTSNMERMCTLLKDAGIRPILATLPMQALWQPFQYKYALGIKQRNWVADYAKKNQIPLLNQCSPTARPDRQLIKAPTSLSRTANVVTAVVTAHGWSTGDWVAQGGTVDAGFTFPASTTKQITVTDANTFTYADTGADGTATNKGTLVRGESITDLTIDGSHMSPKGASKIALQWEPVLDKLFPQVDDLCDTEADYVNICGSGVAGAADHQAVNRSMMTGTTGTRSGTAVSHTGNVATGWGSNVISGNPTSVVCAKVPRTEASYEHQEWQEIAITASGANTVHQLSISQSLPSDWAATTAKSLGNFVKPTVQNGYFYVCIVAGTTAASQPTWPLRLADTVVDGTVTWECRSGWKAGDKVFAAAEYRIQSMSADDAILILSFGLVDTADDTRSIMDFDWDDVPTAAPLYQQGENGYFCTPEAIINAATTVIALGMRTTIKANKSATLRVTRVTWKRVS